MKNVTLIKLVQLGVGTKKGTQDPDVGNCINGMIELDIQHWYYQNCHWGWG